MPDRASPDFPVRPISPPTFSPPVTFRSAPAKAAVIRGIPPRSKKAAPAHKTSPANIVWNLPKCRQDFALGLPRAPFRTIPFAPTLVHHVQPSLRPARLQPARASGFSALLEKSAVAPRTQFRPRLRRPPPRQQTPAYFLEGIRSARAASPPRQATPPLQPQ